MHAEGSCLAIAVGYVAVLYAGVLRRPCQHCSDSAHARLAPLGRL
jgi:hypothetical protein